MKAQKILFRRLPRNASTTFESLVSVIPNYLVLKKHKSLDDYSREIPEWDKAFVFTVVRHPYDRVVSMYHWFRRDQSFENFVRSLEERKHFNDQQIWHTNSQFPFITINGEIALHLLRFDRLQNDFDAMCEKLGVECKLPHLNNSKCNYNCEHYLTPFTRRLVRNVYEEDFKLFES